MTNHTRTIDLGGAQLTAFEGRPGERVRVLFGAVWLTQEGETGDAILRPGADLSLCGGRTVVEALETARLQILGAAPKAHPLQWLTRGARYWATRLQLGPLPHDGLQHQEPLLAVSG